MTEDIGSKNGVDDLQRERFDFETKRFEFEQYKFQRELMLDTQRHALERYKSRLERRFLNRNLGVLISAAISLAAVLVSIGNIWVASISKDKELALALLQTTAENQRLDKQKEKELALQSAEHERQWNLNRAKFITENAQTLFNGGASKLNRTSMIIETLFPGDIAARMFADLKNTANTPERQEVWRNAQKRLQSRPDLYDTASPLPARSDLSRKSCFQINAGATIYGTYDCRLKSPGGRPCTYDCSCMQLLPGYSCDDVLVEAGIKPSPSTSPNGPGKKARESDF